MGNDTRIINFRYFVIFEHPYAEMLEEMMEKKRKEEEQLIREARWGPRRGRRRS